MKRLDYVITNQNKKIYVRLNKNGQPETCSLIHAQRFESSKARNILDHLPKTLKRFNFKVEPISDTIFRENIKKSKSIKTSEEYELPDTILKWEGKFGLCSDVFDEARQRAKDLVKELDNYDNELLDILHIIELEKSKDLYSGWKLYKRIRENRKGRRKVKDEIIIIENVLGNVNSTYLNRDRIKKSIDGLFKRKYKLRIIEEEINDDL